MNNSHTFVTKSARALLAGFVLAAPLLFSTATVEGFEDLKGAALALTTLAFVAFGLVAILYAKLRPQAALRQPLVIGVLIFAASAIVSTFVSISPRTSWRGATDSHAGLMTILGFVVLFFAARSLGSTRRLLAVVVVAAAGASLYALVQAAGRDPVLWDGAAYLGAQPRPFGTLGHANLLGAYLAMTLPLIAYLALRSAQRRRWWLVAVLAVVAVTVGLTLLLTLSRAAWLAAGCATLVLLGGWSLSRARKAAGTILIALLIGTGAGGVAYAAHWLPTELQTALGERFRKLDDGAGRRDIWEAGLQIYRDHPVTGSGLDTFRLAFGAKRTAAFWDKEGEGTPTKAHNEMIHILATQGTLGGAAVLLMFAGLVWAMVRGWRRSADRPLIAALAASVVAFVVSGLFGFTVVATGSLFAVLAGLLSRRSEAIEPPVPLALDISGWRHCATPCIAFATLIAGYLGVVEPLLANMACRRGDLLLADSPAKAAESYQQALKLDSGSDLYYIRLADAARREGMRTGSAEEMKRTRTALERAVALVPADAYHHANLARFLGDLARADHSVSETALAEWRQASALDPNNPYILAEAARTALVIGNYPLARDYAQHGVEQYPSWAIFHAQMGAVALAQGNMPEALFGLKEALNADWHNDGEALGRDLAMLATVELRLQDYGRAEDFAARASTWLPQWPTPHLMRAQALKELGRRDEAMKEMLTARSLQGQPMPPLTSSASPR